jgi:hypothetical protein
MRNLLAARVIFLVKMGCSESAIEYEARKEMREKRQYMKTGNTTYVKMIPLTNMGFSRLDLHYYNPADEQLYTYENERFNLHDTIDGVYKFVGKYGFMFEYKADVLLKDLRSTYVRRYK